MSKRKADHDGDGSKDATGGRVRKSRFEDPEPVPAAPAIDLAALQAQLAAQIAAASAALQSAQSAAPVAVKKAAYHALRLDAQGREIDEQGNLVKQEGPVKTVTLNSAGPPKKKENPYLTHRSSTSNNNKAAAVVGAAVGAAVGAGAIAEEAGADSLALPNSARDIRGKRGLKFVEAGKYVEQELMDRQREERRVRFGFASGRNAPEMIEEKDASSSTSASSLTAPAADEGLVPELEWWDEAFLPKEKREAIKAAAAQSSASTAVLVDDEDINNCRRLLDVANCKTFNLVQHPVAIKALGGDKPEVPLPMYLTKKEQKRIRKTRRQQAEQERRDKQMMGLIPAPEPKFKLSNFMKILGDQAVADPSKVEARVMQQVRQREIAHEMRNLAAKLTPAQRREKQIRKAQEAASTLRQITVAAFCVKSLANPRHRFKVDMNAQQHYLTGTVVLCPTDSLNLVYVEGGPKGIRKFTRLMLHRIDWDEVAEDVVPKDAEKEGGDDDDDDDDDEEDDEDSDDDDDEGGKPSNVRAASLNRCELVWQGVTAKRLFSGLKFVEVKSRQSGRNLLEEKSLAHFWDSTESTLAVASQS